LKKLNAVGEVFQAVIIHGCFYHLTQNIYRKIQSAGLQERYQNDDDLSLSLRMLPALAFVPTIKVIHAFETLQDSMSEELAAVTDYFEDNYIGPLRRQRQRASPTFAINFWNVHDRVENELPRTNNAVEGWNRKMQSAVGCHHPNIWRFIGILKREFGLNHAKMDQLNGGHLPPPQKKKYKDCNARIVHVVRDFAHRDVLDYLKGIANNINF